MVKESILQHWIVTRFALPFLLIFFIVFAILEKTGVLGKDKKQLNALVAFVVGLIFVSVLEPTIFVSNMILFLTVALVTVFIALLLWGFISGGSEVKIESKALKIGGLIFVIVAVIFAVFWAAGIQETVFNFLFGQSWSNTFWTNFAFIVVIAAALALVLKTQK